MNILRKIAYIENDQGLCTIVKKCIEKTSNYTVNTYKSGATFFEELDEYQPDLIILDICLPQMDGLTILTSLREKPLFQKTPVIIFTAQLDESHLQQYRDLGADEIVFKPFNPINLVSFINIFWKLYGK